MSALPIPRMTPEEYLRRERPAEFRSEYSRGRVFLKPRSNPSHCLIVTNLLTSLGTQLRLRNCRVYSTQMRVGAGGGAAYFYPDVLVTCGRERIEDHHDDILLNPVVVIEVLSHLTEAFDRGDKFRDYQLIPSLREYVLISPSPRRFEIFRRQDDNSWLYESWPFSPRPFVLQSIDCTLVPEDVYLKVEDDEAGGGET